LEFAILDSKLQGRAIYLLISLNGIYDVAQWTMFCRIEKRKKVMPSFLREKNIKYQGVLHET
jgi:hypothetical protein